MKPKFSTGDRVAYSVQFLRSIGMSHSDMAHARGTIVGLQLLGSETLLAQIAWDEDTDMPAKVNVFNLALVGRNRLFSNTD